MKVALQVLGQEPTEFELNEMMSKIDSDGNGELDSFGRHQEETDALQTLRSDRLRGVSDDDTHQQSWNGSP